MKLVSILLVLLSVPTVSFAEATKVIFFGGATAQKSVLDRCFPDFENYGYPAGKAVANVVKNINNNPNTRYIIAGHSSGAEFANRVVSAKGLKNPERITLVDLDGFAPRGVPKSIKRVCWNAAGGAKGGIKSRNFDAMSKGNNCGEVHTFPSKQCRTAWCMHFSMVNPAVPGDLHEKFVTVKGKFTTDKKGKRRPVRRLASPLHNNWIDDGYKNCSRAALPWVKP